MPMGGMNMHQSWWSSDAATTSASLYAQLAHDVGDQLGRASFLT